MKVTKTYSIEIRAMVFQLSEAEFAQLREAVNSVSPDLKFEKPEDDDWIPWDGGECPVYPNALVEARLRTGFAGIRKASDWNWSKGTGATIVAYRITKP